MPLSAEELTHQYTERLEQLRAELKERFPSAEQAKSNPEDVLSSSALDDKLAQYVVLYEGTPAGLATFASQSDINHALFEAFLGNTPLLKQVLLADSPTTTGRGTEWRPAQYGNFLHIYYEILHKSEHAKAQQAHDGILHRLALAIALEHAAPLPQDNPKAAVKDDAPAFVDPVQRYLSFEKAFLDGQLDPAFDTLTAWDLRFVVDGEEPDATLEWGRHMLQHYRPDHVLQTNHVWRYVGMVNSNIRYGSHNVKYDRPELQQYQNILMNGGVCGRRAFFGRFILRAFGIPTTARPSSGHGALCHWTPGGQWVVNLGPAFGNGWTKTKYDRDLDFVATTQARRDQDNYWKVKRAQWMGDVHEEYRIWGERTKHAANHLGEWYGISLQVQKEMIAAMDSTKIQPRSCPAGQHQPTQIERVLQAPSPASAKTIQYNKNGTIHIPAGATKPARDVQVMKSFGTDGSFQMYLPDFQPQGLTIVRGGTWKCPPDKCNSGTRLKSGGYGKYEDWGFRLAISGPGGDEDDEDNHSNVCPNPSMTVDIVGDGSVNMEFVYIPPGTFVMGGENADDGRFACVEVPKHQVTLTRGFYLGKYPVTQAQYQAVMGTNPSKSTKAPDCPVDNIGESDAMDYVAKLVETIGKDFRLPTEAEWEYAARGGKGDTKWFFGDDPALMGEYMWYKDNAGGKSHPVGQKKPNPFGLYDMYGNVWERVNDKYAMDYYAKSPAVDPTGPQQGTKSTFEYKIRAPSAGNYQLVAHVVTANSGQRLNVCVNGDDASTKLLGLPWTNGQWQTSDPVTLSLQAGDNTLKFWRDNPPQNGISIQSFTIQPVNQSIK